MKIENTNRVVDDIQNKTTFGISAEGPLFQALSTSVYSDKPLAVFREYSSNALDVHKEIGQTRPVEIGIEIKGQTQVLYFQDYGTGLSDEMIKQIFIVYGKSTKRESEYSIGGFGIGSKSAFAYSNNFQVESVIDNKKSLYSFMVDSDFVPTASLIHQIDTVEPNGVRVSVPIQQSDFSAFRYVANEMLRFRDPSLYTVKGMKITNDVEPVESIGNVTTYRLTDDSSMSTPSYTYNNHIVLLVAGIPYNIPSSITSPKLKCLTKNNCFVAIDFSASDVSVALSREHIQLNKKTIKTIENALKSEDFMELVQKTEDRFVQDILNSPRLTNIEKVAQLRELNQSLTVPISNEPFMLQLQRAARSDVFNFLRKVKSADGQILTKNFSDRLSHPKFNKATVSTMLSSTNVSIVLKQTRAAVPKKHVRYNQLAFAFVVKEFIDGEHLLTEARKLYGNDNVNLVRINKPAPSRSIERADPYLNVNKIKFNDGSDGLWQHKHAIIDIKSFVDVVVAKFKDVKRFNFCIEYYKGVHSLHVLSHPRSTLPSNVNMALLLRDTKVNAKQLLVLQEELQKHFSSVTFSTLKESYGTIQQWADARATDVFVNKLRDNLKPIYKVEDQRIAKSLGLTVVKHIPNQYEAERIWGYKEVAAANPSIVWDTVLDKLKQVPVGTLVNFFDERFVTKTLKFKIKHADIKELIEEIK